MKTEQMQIPTEGKLFLVEPLKLIDQKIFKKKRNDVRQEWVRKIILEAFEQVKINQSKYGKTFNTLMPKKEWQEKNVQELKQLANELGDHMAYWVEQALEWAQRIFNGETWETLCNTADTSNWYRMIVWKDGEVRLVGGSSKSESHIPPADVFDFHYDDEIKIGGTIPLVVIYE